MSKGVVEQFVGDLGRELDFPELENMGPDEIGEHFLPAAVTGLSDGDMAIIHPMYAAPYKVKMYGESLYNHGEVAQRIKEAAIVAANQPGIMREFQDLAARYCNMPESPFYDNERTKLSVQIHPEVIVVDEEIIALRKSPKLVVDYTACLSSRSLISDQVAFLSQDNITPFVYVPITRMHFTDLMLMHTYDRRYGQDMSDTMINHRLFMGMETGIAAATDEMIRCQEAAGRPAEVADIILCNDQQHTTREDLIHGAKNAYTMCQEEGLFIIRSFANPSGDEIGTDEIAGWAFEAGFQEKTALEYDAMSHSPGARALNHGSALRGMKTLILAK